MKIHFKEVLLPKYSQYSRQNTIPLTKHTSLKVAVSIIHNVARKLFHLSIWPSCPKKSLTTAIKRQIATAHKLVRIWKEVLVGKK